MKPNEARFVVGTKDATRGASFKIFVRKSDVYVQQRESRGVKLSLHQSGIFRLARLDRGRDRLIEETIFPGQQEYATICRIVFTTATDWSAGSHPIGDAFYINLTSRTDVGAVVITLARQAANLPRHVNIVKKLPLANGWDVVLSTGIIRRHRFLSDINLVHGPQFRTNLYTERYILHGPNGEESPFYIRSTYYKSVLQTYYIWCHHRIPRNRALDWWKTDQIFQALLKTNDTEIARHAPNQQSFFREGWADEELYLPVPPPCGDAFPGWGATGIIFPR